MKLKFSGMFVLILIFTFLKKDPEIWFLFYISNLIEKISLNNSLYHQQGGTIRVPAVKKPREDYSEFSFAKFAATYFVGNSTSQFNKRPLKTSLLDHLQPLDEIASQAIWITILRFMGDMAEAKYEDDDPESRRTPMMQKLNQSIGRAQARTQEVNNFVNGGGADYNRQRLIHRTLKNRSKIPNEIRQAIEGVEDFSDYYQNILDTRSDNLNKIHFIIGHGIMRPGLRDEIYCQICKQLTRNPTSVSHARGWILLSLCIGCFAPSEKFLKYLIEFIRRGPELYAPYCEDRLLRTIKNGARKQPPSYLELIATRTKQPITLSIVLFDGTTRKLQVDSATNALEIVDQLCDNIGIRDKFGFSVLITLFEKWFPLGSGSEHILDAISSCEQHAKEMGASEKNTPFKIIFRKEIFTPWYNPADDKTATDLIYRQIVKGLNYGEYRCKSERHIAMISALYYYAEHGFNIDAILLKQALSDSIPKDLITNGSKTIAQYEKLVLEEFNKSQTIKDREPQEIAKEDIVLYAQLNWNMSFSRFYDAVQIDGPKLPEFSIFIAINGSGVYFLNKKEEILDDLDFCEIIAVSSEADDETDLDIFTINTVQKDDFVFKCFDGATISKLIEHFLNGLKQHSKYAVAVRDYSSTDDNATGLTMKKGDLIELDEEFASGKLISSDLTWASGTANGRQGDFPTEVVYILPCIMPPSVEVLKIFKVCSYWIKLCEYLLNNFVCFDLTQIDNAIKQKRHAAPKYNTLQRQRMHNLRRYGNEHYRKTVA